MGSGKIILVLGPAILSLQVFGQPADSLLDVANAKYQQDDYEGCLALLNRYMLQDNNTARAYTLRSVCFRKKGEYDKGIADAWAAICLESTNKQAYNELGVIYAIRNKTDSALVFFAKALEADSQYTRGYINRGATYYLAKDYARTLEDYNRALAIEPVEEYVHYNRGICYRVLGRYAEAIADLSFVIHKSDKDFKAHYDRGIAYFEINKNRKAKRDFLKALKYNSTYDPYEALDLKQLYWYLANCHSRLGHKRKMNEYFAKQRAINGD